MRRVAFAACLIALSGCGTLIHDRSSTVRSAISGVGTQDGTGPVGPTRQTDLRSVNLIAEIEAYTGQASPPKQGTGGTQGTDGSTHDQTPTATKTLEQAIADFDRSGTADTRKNARNEIVGDVMFSSETNCKVYTDYLRGNEIAINAWSSALATILSGAASVATPAASNHILAALGSMSSGVGGNLNNALFSRAAAETIVSGINADRAEAKAKIIAKEQGQTYAQWPLMMALLDAMEYHNRCDVMTGLAYLQNAALKNKTTAEDKTAPPPTSTDSSGGPAEISAAAKAMEPA